MTYAWLLVSHTLLMMSGALSLGVLAGNLGLLSIAHVAFIGVGSYTTAILTKTYIWPWPLAFLVAILFGALTALLVAYPILKLRKDAAILATVGASIVIHNIFQNWTSLTRGPLGIKAIPTIRWPGLFALNEEWMIATAAAIWLVIMIFVFKKILKTPLLSVLMAIREREIAATTAGHRTTIRRLEIFVLTAGLAAGTGSLMAAKLSYIDPTLYTLDASIMLLFMVIVGGLGTLRGSIIGAAFLTLLPETLRYLNVPIAITAQLQQALVGLAILLVMRFRPSGIWGNFRL